MAKRNSIYRSIVLSLICFTLFPTIVLDVVYYFWSFQYINEENAKQSAVMLDNICMELNYLMESIERMGDMAANNMKIQQNLRMDFGENTALRYARDLECEAELAFASVLQPRISGLTIVGENGSEYKSHGNAFIRQIHHEQPWYQQICSSTDGVWFSTHPGRFANVCDMGGYVTYGKRIADKSTGAICGVVLVDIKESVLREILSASLGEEGYFLLLDQQEQVISSPTGMGGVLAGMGGLPDGDGETTVLLNVRQNDGQERTSRMIVSQKELGKAAWKVMGVIPVRQINRLGETLTKITFAATALITVSALFAARNISNRIVRPIQTLRETMKQVELGDFDIEMGHDRNAGYQETRQLSATFLRMVDRIKELMDAIYEDQRKLRKAEMTALQAQINPHFLYNTLDSMLWLNRAGRQEELQVMVESLTRFFRIGISRGKDVIPIEEEIQHLESYLAIQMIRYQDKFQYAVELQEECRKCMVPKLILQPLAENAIYHGVKLKKAKSQLTISITTDGEWLHICVADTGQGMSAERLDKLNRILHGEHTEGIEVYGTKNIYERLQIMTDDRAEMYFWSEEGKGTKAFVKIPFVTGAPEAGADRMAAGDADAEE